MFFMCKLEPNNIIPCENSLFQGSALAVPGGPFMPYFCTRVTRKSNFLKKSYAERP